MRFVDGGAWCNALWLLLCLATVYVAVYYSTIRAFKAAWHKLNAEAMAQAVEDTAVTEGITGQISAVDDGVSRLKRQMRQMRDGGEDGDGCGRGR